jgi:LTXXQ motif family protein
MRAFTAPHFSPPPSAPRLAPRVVMPPVSSPRISVPNISQNARIPSTIRIAPQPFIRPAQGAQPHIISGRSGSAPAPSAAAPHIIAPSNQAARAFGLAGVHQLGSSHIIRNPFFATRPALAHATFHGRFAQFARRHHHRFGPVIVVGFIGPLFWPYAYDDFLDYTFYPYAYDAFWPYAYDDVYNGVIGYGAGIGPSAGSGTGSGYVCTGQTEGVTDWRIDDIAKTVEADEVQRAALDEFRMAVVKALDVLKGACPTNLPSTPTGRIEAMRVRLSAMLQAVRTVRAPLAKFYDLLDDEQKARFNTLPSAGDQNEPEKRRDLAELCSERASGISSLPIEQMERAVQPNEAQRASLRDLREAITRTGEFLKANCPTSRPITPVVRIDAMEQRLETMLRAVNIVQPALLTFYGSLTDEQKERFNRLTPAQS